MYRAEDLTLGRDAALKFLSADMPADPQARRRLLKEAQAASRLNHPNIATIYEVNVTESTPFISMELVEGETLKQMLLRAALTPAQFVSAGRQSPKACMMPIALASITAISSRETSCWTRGPA